MRRHAAGLAIRASGGLSPWARLQAASPVIDAEGMEDVEQCGDEGEELEEERGLLGHWLRDNPCPSL